MSEIEQVREYPDEILLILAAQKIKECLGASSEILDILISRKNIINDGSSNIYDNENFSISPNIIGKNLSQTRNKNSDKSYIFAKLSFDTFDQSFFFTLKSKWPSLTNAEIVVLCILYQNRGKFVSTSGICQLLDSKSIAVVRVYINKLRKEICNEYPAFEILTVLHGYGLSQSSAVILESIIET